MKSIANYIGLLLMGITVAACSTQEQPVEWPQVTNETRPWTRWWWEGNIVRPMDLDSIMPLYREAGLGGLEITPIYGAHGYEDRFKDFLSPEWVDVFMYTLDKAKQLDLGIDLANASGWPFGGPWITAEDACKTLAYKVWHLKGGERLTEPVRYEEPGLVRVAGLKPVKLEQLQKPVTANKNLQELALDQVRYPGQLPVIILTANNIQGESIDLTGKLRPDGTLDWTAPEGDWTLCALFEGLHGKLVERAGPGGEGDVIDHFSADAIDAYLKGFDEAFADKDLSGLRYYFNDSYEVDDAQGEANWTPRMFDEFQKRRGYDLRRNLPALLGEDLPETNARVLYDYRITVSDLLAEYYSTRWHKWAVRQGKGIRNQAHGSPANILDLYAISDVPEIEGKDLVSIKAASSVAHTEGKRLTSSESATWLNEHFLSNLGDVKEALDLFFLGGVNHIFYHGTCFSPLDASWPGLLFYAAVHFHPNNPFWNDFKYLNAYVTRVQSFLQSGKPDNDILLYYNIADVLSEQSPTILQHFSGLDRNMAKSSTRQVAEQLLKEGYAWDLISDKQLLNTHVENGSIVTKGGTSYKAVIIAEADYIPLETMEQLAALAQEGAHIAFCSALPKSVAGWGDMKAKSERYTAMQKAMNDCICPSDKLTSWMEKAGIHPEPMYQQGLQCLRRITENGHTYFIANPTEQAITGWIPLRSNETYSAIFNPMTGQDGIAPTRKTDEGLEVYLNLEPGETVLLSTSDIRFKGDAYPYYETAGKPIDLAQGWTLNFVKGGPQLPPTVQMDTLRSWTLLKDETYQSFSGTACYENIIPEMPATECIKLDLGDLAESATVYLNGEYIGTVLKAPYELYISSTRFKGNDTLQVYVSNLMANRIADMDRKKIFWKRFYNVNIAARRPENRKEGIFNASDWKPKPSGLFGPVTLTPMQQLYFNEE